MRHHSMVADMEQHLNTVSLHQTNTQILLNINSPTILLRTANQLHKGTLMPTTRAAATLTNTSNTNDLNHYQHPNLVTVQPV